MSADPTGQQLGDGESALSLRRGSLPVRGVMGGEAGLVTTDQPYYEQLQRVLDQERSHLQKKRQFLQTVNHEAAGATRRRNISVLRSGTGGGTLPKMSGKKPQTVAYNTARGSSYNKKLKDYNRSQLGQGYSSGADEDGIKRLVDSTDYGTTHEMKSTQRGVSSFNDGPSLLQYVRNANNNTSRLNHVGTSGGSLATDRDARTNVLGEINEDAYLVANQNPWAFTRRETSTKQYSSRCKTPGLEGYPPGPESRALNTLASDYAFRQKGHQHYDRTNSTTIREGRGPTPEQQHDLALMKAFMPGMVRLNSNEGRRGQPPGSKGSLKSANSDIEDLISSQ